MATGNNALRSLCGIALCGVSVLLLSGCLASAPPRPQTLPMPEFRPEVFFSGRTKGEGKLLQRWHAPKALHVEGLGQMEADSTFRLDQTVTFRDGTMEKRTWHMRRLDAHTYSATLSDAAGKVSAETHGNLFHLRYLLRQPAVYMEQWIYLQPGGRVANNEATVTILGVPWVRLSERITRSDSAISPR
ncbi:MAG: DUF3833 family protein [Gemmatimonadaceae bacterium]